MAGELQSRSLSETKSAVQVASELAERQFGTVARRQLAAAGISPSQIRTWERLGRLHRRQAGVFAWGRPELSTAGELAVPLLLAGPGAALASLTALWWMHLLNRRPSAIHVASPRRVRSRVGIELSRSQGVDRRFHRGLPVVPLPEALLAAGMELSRDSLRLVLARAEFEHLLDRPALEAVLRSGRPGTVSLRAAVDAHLPALARCANGFERGFVLLCERCRLPIPEPNERIARYRPDMLWREAMLIVELDGRDAHSTAAQLASDARRQAELERRGYTLLRFTSADVRDEPERIAAELRQRLG